MSKRTDARRPRLADKHAAMAANATAEAAKPRKATKVVVKKRAQKK